MSYNVFSSFIKQIGKNVEKYVFVMEIQFLKKKCNLWNFCQILDTTKLESNNISNVVMITFICMLK
jgi:hypothetical protein